MQKMKFSEDNVTQPEVLATLDFLQKITDSQPQRAVAIAATVLASFIFDEATALEVVSDVFALANED